MRAAHPFDLCCVPNGSDGEAYWRDVGTVDAYWDANIDLTATEPKLNLYDQRWPIWTYQPQLPPAKFVHNQDDRRGMAIESLVSGGCIVSGAVFRSVLFSSVRVHSHSSVNWSVLLPNVQVGRGARLTRTVIDRGCQIPDGMVIGEDAELDARAFSPQRQRHLPGHARHAGQARCMRVLHAGAEVFPLVKTGGLADVMGALPQALVAQGADVRLVLPGLPAIVRGVEQPAPGVRDRADVRCRPRQPAPGRGRVSAACRPMWSMRRTCTGARAIPISTPAAPSGATTCSASRLLGWVAAHLASGELDADWVPDLVHAHDWHAALACAYMAAHPAARAQLGVHRAQPGLPGPVRCARFPPARVCRRVSWCPARWSSMASCRS